MKNIVRDIKENCPECECDVEKTVQFLNDRNDLTSTSDYYREVWFFYIQKIGELTSKGSSNLNARREAKTATMNHFDISLTTFKRIKDKLDRDSYDGHKQIFDFYNKLLSKKVPKKEAREKTMSQFNVSFYTFQYATYYKKGLYSRT